MATNSPLSHILLVGHTQEVVAVLRAFFTAEHGGLVTDLAASSDCPRFLKASNAPFVVLVGLVVPTSDPRFFDALDTSLAAYGQERRVIAGFTTDPERLDPALRARLHELHIPIATMPLDVDDLPSTVQRLEAHSRESLGLPESTGDSLG